MCGLVPVGLWANSLWRNGYCEMGRGGAGAGKRDHFHFDFQTSMYFEVNHIIGLRTTLPLG